MCYKIPPSDLSRVSEAIISFRKLNSLNQTDFAKAIGVSTSCLNQLEHQLAGHGEIITPAIYSALRSVGLDLKLSIPTLLVVKRRGKDRNFKPDPSVIIKERRDPVEMLSKAQELISEATAIIKHVENDDFYSNNAYSCF